MPANTGRNDPCPCGSGKKYKQCHLAADEAKEREARAKADGRRAGSRRRSRGRGRGPRAGRAAEARDAPALEEDRDQHAGLRQDQPAPQGGRRLGVAWRRLAAALVAASGLACASATNYLDPPGPLHEFRREAAARPRRPWPRRCAWSASTSPTRSTSTVRSRCCAGARRCGIPTCSRCRRWTPRDRADREGARDERGLLPERGPPEVPPRLRLRRAVAVAARGAAQARAAARRAGQRPAPLRDGRPRSCAARSGSASTRSTCRRRSRSRAARGARSCASSAPTRPRARTRC